MREWEGGIEHLERLREYNSDLLNAQFITDRFMRQLKKGELLQALLSRASAIRATVEHLESGEVAL